MSLRSVTILTLILVVPMSYCLVFLIFGLGSHFHPILITVATLFWYCGLLCDSNHELDSSREREVLVGIFESGLQNRKKIIFSQIQNLINERLFFCESFRTFKRNWSTIFRRLGSMYIDIAKCQNINTFVVI